MLVTREGHCRQREWQVQNPCSKTTLGVTRNNKMLRMAKAEEEEEGQEIRLVTWPWADSS